MLTEKEKETRKTTYLKRHEYYKKKANEYYYKNKEKRLEDTKRWKKENPEKFKAAQNKWLSKNPNYVMYHNARRRAIELGIPFTISFKDITIPSHCPILGIEFKVQDDREYRPSLDRIIPSLGYVPGNIAIISMRANRIKSDGSAEEHRKIAEYMESTD